MVIYYSHTPLSPSSTDYDFDDWRFFFICLSRLGVHVGLSPPFLHTHFQNRCYVHVSVKYIDIMKIIKKKIKTKIEQMSAKVIKLSTSSKEQDLKM